MRTISSALKAHLAQGYQTIASCWTVTLTNSTVLGFTDHDRDIVFSGVTYKAISGYTTSANTSSDQMDVDTLEVSGPQVEPTIVDADIEAGLWDFAQISLFQVNWADLTMGALHLRDGWLGQVSTGRFDFKAELRGLNQAYARTAGRLYLPSCDATLGDARCTIVLTPFTVTGTLTGVNPDGLTLYDTARTEPGPAGGGVAITGITNANPGIVTMASRGDPPFDSNTVVLLSGIVGPSLLNVQTVIRELSSDGLSWSLDVNTTDTAVYPVYVSGGLVTPLGADSGYFDHGLITMTSGLNNGLKMEVAAYVPGQWTLMLPFPYACVVGDTYSMIAGCDKTLPTCVNKFNNVLNFRGFPVLPGNDQLVQVGRTG